MAKLKSNIKIVILQRGWVYVGRFFEGKDEMRLEGAKCIRRWGTTKGLGEIVSGPTTSTVLDPAGTVRFHPMTVVAMLDTEGDKWSAICA